MELVNLRVASQLALGLALAPAAVAGNGNGTPNGAHYTLNLVGVPHGKTADMNGANGHVIFVDEKGTSKIWLCEAGVDDDCFFVADFQVLDANATSEDPDNDGGLFALPNPDPDGDGTTKYSVFVKVLGTPGGSGTIGTCATDPSDGITVCSDIELELSRDKGNHTKFDNVTKELLYVYADLDGTGTKRYPLFDDALQGYLWELDNNGLKLVQLRFYECATTVPDATDPNGAVIDETCFQ